MGFSMLGGVIHHELFLCMYVNAIFELVAVDSNLAWMAKQWIQHDRNKLHHRP